MQSTSVLTRRRGPSTSCMRLTGYIYSSTRGTSTPILDIFHNISSKPYRWYNITYLTFAASIILFRAVQSIQEPNPHHDYIRLIEQTLSMFDIMRESVVACKTAKVLRQMLASLCQRAGRSSTAAGVPGGGVGAAESQKMPMQEQPGPPAAFGGNLEVAHLGLESLDGCQWDWSFDFRDIWESHGGGFHGLS